MEDRDPNANAYFIQPLLCLKCLSLLITFMILVKCVYANSVVFLATIQMHTPLSIILGKSYRVQLSTHPMIISVLQVVLH